MEACHAASCSEKVAIAERKELFFCVQLLVLLKFKAKKKEEKKKKKI